MDIQTCKKTAGKTCLFVYPNNEKTTDELITSSVKSYLGKDEKIIIERKEKGKPYITTPFGVFISVSHSGEYCIVAVSDIEIGVDIQIHERLRGETEFDSNERYQKLAKRFFHPEENEFVNLNVKQNFFDVWSAKESYVKYTGEGIDDNFWTYSILPENTKEMEASWSKNNVFFEKIKFCKGYSLCLCSENKTNIEIISCNEV